MDALALLAEHSQDLDRAVAGAPEPVRVPRVELGRLARAHDDVVLAQDHPQPTRQDVNPLVAAVRAQLRLTLGCGNSVLKRPRPTRHGVGKPRGR